MATPTPARMRTLFPAFAGVADPPIQLWIDEAPCRFTASRFGKQWEMAVYLFTAHHLECFGTGDDTDGIGDGADSEVRGPVMAESVLDASRSYGGAVELSKVSAGLQWYSTTKYGLKLISIIKSRAAVKPRVVRTFASRW